MNRRICLTSFFAVFMVFFTFLFASVAVHAANDVVLWNKLDGGSGGSPSEVGPQLYNYDPSMDGGTGCCDVIGNVQFVPGKFGNAATLGTGNYYSTARVHAMTLRNLNTVLNPEHGTIAVWYNEKVRPMAYQQNLYRIFDGGFGLDSPLQLYVCDNTCYGGQSNKLIFEVRFGGQDNTVLADFDVTLNEWVHIAAVWDRNGIEGTSDTVRLYINGIIAGAILTNSWGTGFNGNHADIAGGNDLIENKFALDNLVIYDYAKTDFSDRFNENPMGQAFSTFTPNASVNLDPKSDDDSFKVSARFGLGVKSNGIDLGAEDVTIKFGSFSTTIPAGEFQQQGLGVFTYNGTINKVYLKVEIHEPKGSSGVTKEWFKPTNYSMNMHAKGANLDGTLLPPEVKLTIGDDTGSAKLDTGKGWFGKGKESGNWLSDDDEGHR